MSEQTNVPPTTEEQKIPTKEELIAFFQEQIEVKKVQLELQQINASMASARADELKALAFISQMTNPQASAPNTTSHIVTQEDLDANPELVEAGVQLGDEVMIPAGPEEQSAPPRKLKKQSSK